MAGLQTFFCTPWKPCIRALDPVVWEATFVGAFFMTERGSQDEVDR